MVEGKECSRCEEWKPRTEFYKEKLGKHGLRSRCIPCMKELSQTYREENREHVLNLWRSNYQANKDLIRERQRAWERENREHVRKVRSKWAEENRDHLSDYRKNRYRDNSYYQDKARSDRDKRRARERNLPYESIDRRSVFERDGWTCGICGDPIPLVTVWPHPLSASVDHIIPLSHPESPGHLRTNVQASHLTCNLRKSNTYN